MSQSAGLQYLSSQTRVELPGMRIPSSAKESLCERTSGYVQRALIGFAGTGLATMGGALAQNIATGTPPFEGMVIPFYQAVGAGLFIAMMRNLYSPSEAFFLSAVAGGVLNCAAAIHKIT